MRLSKNSRSKITAVGERSHDAMRFMMAQQIARTICVQMSTEYKISSKGEVFQQAKRCCEHLPVPAGKYQDTFDDLCHWRFGVDDASHHSVHNADHCITGFGNPTRRINKQFDRCA